LGRDRLNFEHAKLKAVHFSDLKNRQPILEGPQIAETVP
jgi:hypothetical protein